MAISRIGTDGIDQTSSQQIGGISVGKGGGNVATNTAVGASALAANTTGNLNTAVGSSALVSNTSGTDNTALGYNALFPNTTGSYNTAIGRSALVGNTTGSYNTALGWGALPSNTTASNNTAVGYQAAYSNTTGSYIDSFGSSALYANTTGNGNSAFGRGVLSANTTGSENAAFGTSYGVYSALRNNTTGSYNVAMGAGSLGSNTTANDSTAVGYQALYSSNRTADVYARNTAVGYQAGYGVTTGYENVLIGRQAGYSLAGGGNNVFVGEEAGYAATGQNNCFVGYGAGSLVTTGAKNTILGRYSGNQGGLDIRTASNWIVLSDGDGNPRAHINQYGTLIMQVGTSAAPPVNANIANSIHLGNGSLGSVSVNPNVFFGNAYGTGGGIPVYCGNWPASNNWAVGLHDGGSSRNVRIGGASVGTGGMSWDGTYANIYAGSYTNASDYRIKENVVALEVGVLASVMALRPVKYRIKKIEGDEQDNRTEIGFIAHELQAQFPELVIGEKDAVDASGNEQHQGVDYAKMTAVLVKAIQELKAEFDAYKEAHP